MQNLDFVICVKNCQYSPLCIIGSRNLMALITLLNIIIMDVVHFIIEKRQLITYKLVGGVYPAVPLFMFYL